MGFKLPEDIKSLSADELAKLAGDVRTYVRTVTSAEAGSSITDLTEARDAYNTVLAEQKEREEAEALRQSLAADVEAEDEDDEDEDETEDDEEVEAATQAPAVVASQSKSKIKTRNLRRSTLDAVPAEEADKFVVMTTASDVPGFGSGVPLESFSQAALALDNRLAAYSPSGAMPRKGAVHSAPRVGPHSFAIEPGRSSIRHGGVMFKRQYPDDLRIKEGSDPERVLKYAAKESRLPGGSLIESAKAQIKAGKALTAAVGWCAPSEVIYDLCDLSSLDGMLDLPEIQATRGGFQLPADGGPNFSVVWNGIGDDGDVILTEYQIENDAIKECFEIPCPDFEDVRLDASYLCLTGSLLQRRGYPEVVEFFSQQAVKALAHKVNESVISRIVTASGAAVVIPADASGDDAASATLAAVDLAIWDIKYSQRMSATTSLEVVMPYWFLVPIRAALSRRYGLGMLDVTDQMIMDWFAIRHAMPRFVYDWQDAYSGLMGGPGGASPLTALPATGQFLVYPAGTWTKIVRDVVNLDTIYDNAMLTTNQYTALFVEDGFNVIQTCPVSRLYTVTLDPSGVVGCCS